MSEKTIKSPRWMRLLLIASLALNLAVLGIVGGAFLRGPEGRGDASVSLGGEFRMLAGSLPKAHQEAMRKDARSHWKELRSFRIVISKQRKSIVVALRSDAFNADAFAAMLKTQHTTWREIGTRGVDLLVLRVRAMSKEERIEFADNLERWRNRHPKHPGRPADR